MPRPTKPSPTPELSDEQIKKLLAPHPPVTFTQRNTDRGFGLIEFRDRYDGLVSIQMSSLATEACVWLGSLPNRAHLTQDMARKLVPILTYFAEHGELPPPEDHHG